jgi:deazaflavin-dependent oxidoreductase (nitroreductase family)
MALRQPERALLSWLGTTRGNHIDARILQVTGHSPYGYLYGKDLGGNRRTYKPPMNLTTIGRRSGKLHTVALAYFPIDGGWAVVGSAHGSTREPHWVANARANPAAWVRLHRRTVPVAATVLDGADKQPIWDAIAARTTVFESFQRGVTRDIPIVLLRPRQPDCRVP